MTGRNAPTEVVEAVERHFKAFHPHAPQPHVGRPNARSASASATWTPAANDESEMFTCRLCPQGYNRHSIEVDAPAPSTRILRKIHNHFATEHNTPTLSVDQVRLLGEEDRGQKAIWEPATLDHGAGFGCMLCPLGQHLYLEPPPYGDAGRLGYLLFQHPELQEKTVGLTPLQQAEYLELWDRGVLRAAQADASRVEALRTMRSAARPKRRAPRKIEPAVQRIMVERLRDGERITKIIQELAQLSRDDPKAFTRLIGKQVPNLPSGIDDADGIAKFLGYPEGSYPSASRTTLWNYRKRSENSRHNTD